MRFCKISSPILKNRMSDFFNVNDDVCLFLISVDVFLLH